MVASTKAETDGRETPKKRKRASAEVDELEIDVNLPEPPSKKALRRAKKGKSTTTTTTTAKSQRDQSDLLDSPDAETTTGKSTVAVNGAAPTDSPLAAEKQEKHAERSKHGIWIGNLAFHVTPATLSAFLCSKGSLQASQITRVHLPLSDRALPPHLARRVTPGEAPRAREQKQNKGFAYVDFDSAEGVFQALQVSEEELEGRKVLIKDAGNFAGRPEKPRVAVGEDNGGEARDQSKPRSKRIFVGNLAFDVTRDQVREHFEQAGEVEDVFLATFEDSGKCKGFGWVRFADEDMAEKAVKGWIWKVEGEGDDLDDDAEADEVDVDVDGAEVGTDEQDDSSVASSSASDEDDGGVDIITEKKASASKKGVNGSGTLKPPLKPQKKRKWWINKLYGRLLRCEYAEDASTRYKKRFGKARPETDAEARAMQRFQREDGGARANHDGGAEASAKPESITQKSVKDKDDGGDEQRRRGKPDAEARAEARRQRHKDARKIAPGKALASAPRASGAIVAGQGKKVTFD